MPMSLARSRSWAAMSARAPTSTPRNGSSSRTRRTLPSNQRPTITFCWLPPDRSVRSASMPGADDPEVRDGAPRAAPLGAPRQQGGAAVLARSRGKLTWCRTDQLGTTAAEPRSSATSATPARTAWAGLAGTVGTPVQGQLATHQRTGAVELLEQLGLARADQPGESDDLADADVEVEGQARRAGFARRGPPGRPSFPTGPRAPATGPPSPSMACTSSRARNGRARIRVTTPSRSTTTRSDTSSISTRSCETNSTATPPAARRRTDASRRVGVSRRQARGRLVEDEHLQVVRQCPGDHHLLALAGRERLDGGVDVDVQPGVLGDHSRQLAVSAGRSGTALRRGAPASRA